MGSTWPTGIVPRNRSIEVRLNYNDKRHYVSLPWRPTAGSIKKAGKLRQQAQEAIKWGTFTWQEFFPDSKHANEETGAQTFKDYGQLYLNTLTCTENTKEKYAQALERFYYPSLAYRLAS